MNARKGIKPNRSVRRRGPSISFAELVQKIGSRSRNYSNGKSERQSKRSVPEKPSAFERKGGRGGLPAPEAAKDTQSRPEICVGPPQRRPVQLALKFTSPDLGTMIAIKLPVAPNTPQQETDPDD
jgi:hypothetical protein